MSEDQTTQNDTQPTEREELEARATTLGIKFHPNIGDDKLREKVNAAVTGSGDDQDEGNEPETQAPAETKSAPKGENAQRLTKKQEASQLVRVRITCMNPNKREWDGEMFTAGNSVVGTFRKFVPFDTDWHVPRIILNMIKQREAQVFVKQRDDRGRPVTRGKTIKEFSVEELEPLTKEELKELAQRQAMANGTAA